MAEAAKNPFDLLIDQIRVVVREEIKAAIKNGFTSSPHSLNGDDPAKARKWEDLTEQEREAIKAKDWLRATELAQLYGLPATWFEEKGRTGEIERAKPGRHVIFNRRAVEAYLEKINGSKRSNGV